VDYEMMKVTVKGIWGASANQLNKHCHRETNFSITFIIIIIIIIIIVIIIPGRARGSVVG
jgi:uncharacterized membrane protein YsdA (DUF1294 family)